MAWPLRWKSAGLSAPCVERAGCKIKLHEHEVDTHHRLGHRMLDLDACIHLEEEEVPAIAIDHELDVPAPR